MQDNPETHNDPSGHLGGGPGQNKIYAELARLRKNDPNFLKVLELLWMVVDLFTGLKSIIHDIQTLLNAQASGTDKLLALGDLTVNVVLDALMFTGVGEVGRGGKLLVSVGRGVLDVIKGIVTGEDVGRAVDDVLHQAEDLVHGACSFTSATRVTTDHGKQAIGTLHVGERVLAYNPKTHKMELEPIVHVWINHDHDLVNLTITTMATKGQHGRVTTPTSDVVHTNQKHPFMTQEQGFLPVGKIKLGMHILQADGHFGVVTGWKVVPGTQVMYNLEVANDHTFAVGSGQWVVHNCASGPQTPGEAYVQQNLSNLIPNAGVNLQSQVKFSVRGATAVADFVTDNAIIEVGGVSKNLNLVNFGKQLSVYAKIAAGSGKKVYFMYDASTGALSADLQRIASRWGVTIIEFTP